MNTASTAYLYGISVIKFIQTAKKKYKVKISSKSYIGILTGSDQRNRKKTSIKTISTGKVKDTREKCKKNQLNFCYTPCLCSTKRLLLSELILEKPC